MRLADIAPEKLAEIQNYCQIEKGKTPVINDTDECLVKIVEKKYGCGLSPAQIYSLQKGMKIYRLSLPAEVVEGLEDKYGSIAKGIKALMGFVKFPELPSNLEKPYRELLKRKEVPVGEIEELLSPFVDEKEDVWKIIGKLGREGLLERWQDTFIIHEFKRDPVAEMLAGLR